MSEPGDLGEMKLIRRNDSLARTGAPQGSVKKMRIDLPRRRRQKIKPTMIPKTLIIALSITTVAAVALADPKQTDERTSTKRQTQAKSPGKTEITPKSLTAGWHNINGEWLHSDGYKYVDGRVVKLKKQTNVHARPPKPPSAELLKSARTTPAATPAQNSAAAKAAEKERNLRPRPAPQTGSHL